MTRKLRIFSALLLLTVPWHLEAQVTSTSTGASSTAQVLISVSDKQGNPVSASKSAFDVYVDKKKTTIDDLRPAGTAPLRFVLLVDLSGSNIDKLKFEKKAAAQIFEALSKGNNEGYFGWFNQNVAISPRPMLLSEVIQFLSNATTRGGTALYDAIAQACQQPLHRASDSPSLRRVLFVITDGEDNQSHISAADASKIVQREAVPLFALGTLSSSFPRATGGTVLKRLARETGGNAIVLDSPNEFLQKLLRPLDAQYFLTFTSPPAKSSIGHLEIKASDHSLKFEAPSMYSND